MDAVTKNLIAAAIKWWEYKRFDMSEREHINNPTANCPTSRGQALAPAIAQYVRMHGSSVDETETAPKPAKRKPPTLAKKKAVKKPVKKVAPPRRKTKK